MSVVYNDVNALFLEENKILQKLSCAVNLKVDRSSKDISLKFLSGADKLIEIKLDKDAEIFKSGRKSCILNQASLCLLLTFSLTDDFKNFFNNVRNMRLDNPISVFNERTEEASAVQYFQFYGYLSQQQNMMQDYIRTSTYQRAILANMSDFKDRVILDVGAGSGILSFFAVQAGAKKVYAVEASSMSTHAEILVKANNLQDKISVIAGKIEEIQLPEYVDTIISEPMGYMLFNERMLETYLHAKKFLKPGGKMFPSRGDLHIAPFTDEVLYMEQFNKANFWYQQCFHGLDLSSLRSAAIEEYFRQPVVDTFDIRICLAKSIRYVVDFHSSSETDLHFIEIPVEFHMLQSGTVHGLAFWFDVAFLGSMQTVWLSTAPTEPLTHWYQVRCLLECPLFVKAGQMLTGKVSLAANKRQSYDVTIELSIETTGFNSINTLDLKNPYFRYTGQPPQPPPGCNNTSPSENIWHQLDEQGARQVNGIHVNGLGDIAMETGSNNNLLASLGRSSMQLPPQLLEFSTSSIASIHPGSIPALGPKQVVCPSSSPCSVSSPTSQLLGGALSPSLIQSPTQQVVLGSTSHYPVNNNLMIGDYVTSGVMHALSATYRS